MWYRWLLAALVISLFSFCSFAQARLWVNVGYSQCAMGESPIFFKPVDSNSLIFKFHSPLVELALENYLNYNTALMIGVGYWQNGYSTEGYHLHVDDYDNKLVIDSDSQTLQIDFSRWITHFVKLPIAIEFAPQGKQLAASLGVEMNLTISSTLRDITDYGGNIYITNITPYFKRVLFNSFFSISYKWKAVTLEAKVFVGVSNYSDANANRAVVNSEIQNQARIASFYRSISVLDITTNGFQLSIGYRLY